MEDFKMDDILDYMNSSYEGEYKNKRMEGNGNYKFATDTKYEGEWKDGMFHGKGTLIFSDGSKYVATWEKGIALEGQYFFEDGLDFDEHRWQYCDGYDRRFHSAYLMGLSPAGRERVVPYEPCPKIPYGHYDTGDGFYNPATRVVTKYDGEFRRTADDDEHTWILATCRKGWDEFIGWKPSLNA